MDVYVNEVKAFTVETPVMAVVAPMEAGFHVVQAILVDAAGARIGVQSEPVHFLVDYEAETSGAGLASEGAGEIQLAAEAAKPDRAAGWLDPFFQRWVRDSNPAAQSDHPPTPDIPGHGV